MINRRGLIVVANGRHHKVEMIAVMASSRFA